MLSCCFVNYFTEVLWLDDNSLVDTIPTEIGQLTKLSEYTCGCCHDVLAQSLWASIHSYPLHDSHGLFVCCAAFLGLTNNSLTGTIPSEINSLTNLSEFVGHCLPPIFFLSLCPHEYAFSWILLCIAGLLELYNNTFTGNYTCPDLIEDCWISCDNYIERQYYTSTCRSLG